MLVHSKCEKEDCTSSNVPYSQLPLSAASGWDYGWGDLCHFGLDQLACCSVEGRVVYTPLPASNAVQCLTDHVASWLTCVDWSVHQLRDGEGPVLLQRGRADCFLRCFPALRMR